VKDGVENKWLSGYRSLISFGDVTFESCFFGNNVHFNIEGKGSVVFRDSWFLADGLVLEANGKSSLSLERTRLTSFNSSSSDDHNAKRLHLRIGQNARFQADNSTVVNGHIDIQSTTEELKVRYQNQLSRCNLTDSSMLVEGSTLSITSSELTGSDWIVSNFSQVEVVQSIFTNTLIDLDASLIEIQNSIMSMSPTQSSTHQVAAIRLNNSTLILRNATTLDYETESISCNDTLSRVLGDYSEWNISSNCVLAFVPLRLEETDSTVQLTFNGQTSYFEIPVAPVMSGFNLTLHLELDNSSIGVPLSSSSSSSSSFFSSLSSTQALPPKSTFINMYLLPVPCSFDTQRGVVTNDDYFIQSSTTNSLVASIAFNGPSPSFMRPDSNNITIYCLVTNSSFVSSGLMRASVAFVSRNLTTATIAFRPGGLALYTHEMAIEYNLFDQWGDPYSNDHADQLAFTSSLCSGGFCGYAYKGLATAERVFSFNFSTWIPVTKVSVFLLPYQTDPATFYCKILTSHTFIIISHMLELA